MVENVKAFKQPSSQAHKVEHGKAAQWKYEA